MIVSDNGTCFTSSEFKTYVTRNDIRHITSAPFHPSTNGLAERAVQTFKKGMKKQPEGSLQTKVSRFLFEYRTRTHATTGHTPVELLFHRELKTRLDLVRPNLRAKVEQKQFDQRRNHQCRKRDGFNEGDSVYVKNYSARGDKWLKGLVVEKGGPVSYKVSLGENVIVKRHIDQMKKCESSIEMPGESEISSEMSIEPSLIGDKSVEI